jgi:hypothetical protein
MCGLLETMTMYMTGFSTVGDNEPEDIAKDGVIVEQKISKGPKLIYLVPALVLVIRLTQRLREYL